MTAITENRARAMREEFDQSFAVEAHTALEQLEDLLMVRVADEPYAIRLRDIGGIVTKRPIVAVPAMADHLLGLAGVRGDVVPVYDLRSILGHTDTAEPPTWMVLCGDTPRIALAFPVFDGYLRLPLSRIHADNEARAVRPYVSEVVRHEQNVSSVINVPRIVAALRKPTRGGL